MYSISDVRAKEEITDIPDGLTLLNKFRPITFKYKGNTSLTQPIVKHISGSVEEATEEIQELQHGFVADEVLTIAPQYIDVGVGEIGDEIVDDFKSMSTQALIPMMVKAIQELSIELDGLQAQISGSNDFNSLKSAVTG